MIWLAIALALAVVFYMTFFREEEPKLFEKKISMMPPVAAAPVPVVETEAPEEKAPAKPKRKYGGKVKKNKQ